MPRSLHRTIVGWYALLLLVAFAVFGTALNLRVRRALLDQVDSALEGHARAIAATIEFDLLSGWEIGIAEEYLARVSSEGWFEVLDPKGRAVKHGGTLPPASAALTEGPRSTGDRREFMVLGPRGSSVRVGRSVAAELAELRGLTAVTAAAGAILLAVVLAGGWWIASRTLRPIRMMSAAAERISESDLSQRLEAREAPTELQGLAATLNDAFGRLERAFERHARFTADASHELRTPLSVARTQLEQALRRERSGEEYRDALRASLRSIERMSRLVEQMLAFARLEGGARGAGEERVELDALVRETLAESSGAARAAEIALELQLEPAQVVGDALQLAEVVANLVSNAIRYNHPGGRVTVSLRAEDRVALLRVSDQGIGIPSEALPHVFERFYQVDPARSRSTGGAGLGLALVERIVRLHGGSVSAESQVGVGTTFTVRLPLATTRGTGAG